MVISLKKFYPYLYCLIISILFIFIASKCSILYQINDWVDANAFFTVGKSMMRGIVPYQSLFEQKGPILYFIYGIGSLVSYKSFFGVFLLEIISFSFFLYYAYKILILYTKKENAYFIIPILSLLVVSLKAFTHGGSAEEFSLPFLMYSFYKLILYLKEENSSNISIKDLLINGLIAGIILLIKYTLLGFWFGFMLIIIIRLIKDKKYQEVILKSLIFLLGMIIACLPWLIYFGVNSAIKDFFDVYFLINIKLYPNKMPFILKLKTTLSLIIQNLFGVSTYLFFIVGGFSLLFINKEKKLLYLVITLLTTAFFIYIGGTNYHYYSLIIAPFIIIGIISLLKTNINIEIKRYSIIICICLSLIGTYYLSNNATMIKLKKENYAQYRFNEIIKQDKNPTLLNFGFLDGGFYTVSGILPNSYYFMKNNISYKNYPKMLDEQINYIKNKQVLYVVTKESATYRKYKNEIESNYLLIDQFTQKYQNKNVTYYLYRLGS